MTKYKSTRIIDRKSRQVIVDETGKIVNKNPNREDLKGIKRFPEKSWNYKNTYTNEQLLDYLRQFRNENGRIPTQDDFNNNPKYPSTGPYIKRFGNWNKSLEKAFDIKREKYKKYEKYTDNELLDYLRQFEKENERRPAEKDFTNNPEYPSYKTYDRFGGWNKALKLVGMDLDTRVMQGHLETETEKGRFAEIIIKEMFDNRGKDISGEIHKSPFDGICPTGQIYEVKSSGLLEHKGWVFWKFGTENKDKDDNIEAIQWYYLIAFNKDYTKILYVWRIPGEIMEKHIIMVSAYGSNSEFNVSNMTEYDITDDLKKMILLRSNNCMLKNLCDGE